MSSLSVSSHRSPPPHPSHAQHHQQSIEDFYLSSRVVKEVPCPPLFPLGKDRGLDKKGMPNLVLLKDHFLKEGRLTLDFASWIIATCSQIFKAEPNMLELRYPITVCGDLHGQFFDMIRLFEVSGDPKEVQYLFLGDYVDRGCFSCECVLYLYALKIVYPKCLFLLRGNHECRQLTAFFNFKDECAYKYNLNFYDEVMSSFDNLPLSALLNKAFFCVHGGLSPDISTLEEIKTMDRFQEIPREGPMCDLLWSDPYEEDANGTNPDALNPDATPNSTASSGNKNQQESTQWFGYNDTRQCSYVYGVEAVKQFLKDNKLTSVIRAHEAQVDGYKMQMINKTSGIPRVITVFSAPNYCDVYKNKAAVLKFDSSVLNIKQFVDSPHPYYLPNFMDVFQWSLPFVAEKVTDMLANILDLDVDDRESLDQRREERESDDETDEKDIKEKSSVVQQRGGTLKKKVKAVTKLLRMYKVLRQENESILQLKQLNPSNKIPFGLLEQGPMAIQNALAGFDQAKLADGLFEKRPVPAGAPPPQPRVFVPRRRTVEDEDESSQSATSSTRISSGILSSNSNMGDGDESGDEDDNEIEMNIQVAPPPPPPPAKKPSFPK